MPTRQLGSRELLEYDASYRILICRECRYAIQKSALESHLLRHKIYRGEREELLASIARLDLLEPHLVPLPTPTSPPISALPIISGYRCAAAGCRNLCASIKRMRRHWSEIHGIRSIQPLPDSSTFACPVTLQTFFRGTKIRYFEVASPDTLGGNTPKEPETEEPESDDQGLHTRSPDPPARLPSLILAESMDPPSRTPLVPSLVDIHLQTLTYLHHFITSTSLTLPDTEHLRPATRYWQTDVVLQALRIHQLMCGLMAISACHMAALVDDALTKRAHHERSVQFFSIFTTAWDGTSMSSSNVLDVKVKEEAEKAGTQLLFQLRCAYWSLAESTFNHRTVIESVAPFELQSFISTIRGLLVPDFKSDPNVTRVHDDDGGGMFAQAKRFLETRSPPNFESFGDPSSGNNASSTLRLVRDHLGELPSRMADGFTKPQNGPDFLATMSAVAALIKCCNISFSSENVGAVWWGMTTWLIKIPGHFNTMLACYSPPAIVVLAHWAALLVRRAENCGVWFLRGLADRTLLKVAERIPALETAVHSLLQSLIVWTVDLQTTQLLS